MVDKVMVDKGTSNTNMSSKQDLTETLTLTHSYKYYIKDISALSKYNIDVKKYKDICTVFNTMLSDHIINEDAWINLPYRLGQLRIRKHKINLDNLKCDFGLFRKTGIKAKHLNEHSGEYYCRFYWNKTKCIVINKSFYSFIPSWTNKRTLASHLKKLGKFITYWN